jgi:hypothetical protein
MERPSMHTGGAKLVVLLNVSIICHIEHASYNTMVLLSMRTRRWGTAFAGIISRLFPKKTMSSQHSCANEKGSFWLCRFSWGRGRLWRLTLRDRVFIFYTFTVVFLIFFLFLNLQFRSMWPPFLVGYFSSFFLCHS